jgi:hypothetical protein
MYYGDILKDLEKAIPFIMHISQEMCGSSDIGLVVIETNETTIVSRRGFSTSLYLSV